MIISSIILKSKESFNMQWTWQVYMLSHDAFLIGKGALKWHLIQVYVIHIVVLQFFELV
jgi:hypothetical protein